MKKLSRLCVIEIAFILVVLLFPGRLTAQIKDRLPNIVYILADDLGYGDLGCYGQKLIRTPNIDRLAKRGKRFTQFYSGSTVCAPSRAAMMTGKHTGHVSIRGNGEFPLPKEEMILPELLKKKGYVNGMMGKWGLGLPGTSGSPEVRGWDYFSGHVHHVEGHYQHPDSAWHIMGGVLQKVKVPGNMYVNEWFTSQAIDFIEKEKSKPFFLYLSFTLPHAELVVPDQYLRPYLNEKGESIFTPEKPHAPGQHYGPQPNPKAAYAAMVSQMDDYVGRVLHQLEKHGLAENTIVIFTSDNGTHKEGGRVLSDAYDVFKSSGPLKGIKRDLYEGGIRVPFIVRWDGRVKPGTISPVPAANWDIMATVAALTGLGTGPIDGVSILPVLTAVDGKFRPGTALSDRVFFWEFYEQGYKQAVRKGKWKAIRYYDGTVAMRTELYNLDADPSESNNLAGREPKLVKELEKQMDLQRTASANPAFQIR